MAAELNETIGAGKFGIGKNMGYHVTTFNNDTYLHIKNRNSQKKTSMRSGDFYQFLKKKDRISKLLDKGNKLIAKKKAAEAAASSSSDEDSLYTSEDELEEATKMVKKSMKTSRKRAKPLKETSSSSEGSGNENEGGSNPKPKVGGASKEETKLQTNDSSTQVEVKASRKSRSKSKKAKLSPQSSNASLGGNETSSPPAKV